jgi:hypothetical protein
MAQKDIYIPHLGGDHNNVWNKDGHDIFHSKLIQYGMDPVAKVIFHSNRSDCYLTTSCHHHLLTVIDSTDLVMIFTVTMSISNHVH